MEGVENTNNFFCSLPVKSKFVFTQLFLIC